MDPDDPRVFVGQMARKVAFAAPGGGDEPHEVAHGIVHPGGIGLLEVGPRGVEAAGGQGLRELGGGILRGEFLLEVDGRAAHVVVLDAVLKGGEDGLEFPMVAGLDDEAVHRVDRVPGVEPVDPRDQKRRGRVLDEDGDDREVDTPGVGDLVEANGVGAPRRVARHEIEDDVALGEPRLDPVVEGLALPHVLVEIDVVAFLLEVARDPFREEGKVIPPIGNENAATRCRYLSLGCFYRPIVKEALPQWKGKRCLSPLERLLCLP